MKQNNLTIKSFRGGISAQGDKGPRGAFKYGEGLNIHGTRDSLKSNQDLMDEYVTEDFVLSMLLSSDGNIYAFGDTGKIYRKKNGTWSKVYEDPDGRITGSAEFKTTNDTYILYATDNKLKRIAQSDADFQSTWTPQDVGNFAHGGNTNKTMRVALGVLVVCDGPVLAMYDFEEGFNPVSLNMPPRVFNNTLLDRANETINRLIMGTVGNGYPEGWFVTWDRLQDSWLAKKSAQGNSVNQMEFLEGGILAQVGAEGHIKIWNFSETYPLAQIPGTTIGRPEAITTYRTLPHFGISGVKGGVYSVGRIDKNDPMAINLEYKPKGEIGALLNDGVDLYVSYKDGSNYGIQKTDPDKKAESLYESLEMDMSQPHIEKTIRQIKVVARELPQNTRIEIEFKTTRNDTWVRAYTQAGDDHMKEGQTTAVFNIEGQGEIYEVRARLIPNDNDTPEVLSINSYFQYSNFV